MDVSLYISELLKQNGEITVPGLGFLVHARVGAFYNEAEGKFYPPHHQVQFDPQVIEDDTLTEYVADQKNISLASAKYFIEKYVEALKNDALENDVAFADLGWFYTYQSALAFKANEALTENAGLFGYEPIEIQQQKAKPIVESIQTPVNTDDDIHAITFTSKAAADDLDDRFPSLLQLDKVYDEGVRRRHTAWYILLTVVLLLGIGFFAVYRFAPSTYEKFRAWEHQIRGIKTDDSTAHTAIKTIPVQKPIIDSVKADSIAKANSVAKADSTRKADSAKMKQKLPLPAVTKKTINTPTAAKQPVNPAKKDSAIKQAPNNTKKSHFELVVSTEATLADANALISRFNSIGVSASLSIDIAGPKSFVIAGIYPTHKEAEAVMLKLKKENKISTTSYIQEIKLK